MANAQSTITCPKCGRKVADVMDDGSIVRHHDGVPEILESGSLLIRCAAYVIRGVKPNGTPLRGKCCNTLRLVVASEPGPMNLPGLLAPEGGGRA